MTDIERIFIAFVIILFNVNLFITSAPMYIREIVATITMILSLLVPFIFIKVIININRIANEEITKRNSKWIER